MVSYLTASVPKKLTKRLDRRTVVTANCLTLLVPRFIITGPVLDRVVTVMASFLIVGTPRRKSQH